MQRMDNTTEFPIIDFTGWEEVTLPVSGIRKKKWLRNNNTGEIGLFKFPKTEYTGDFWAEKLAHEIGTLIGIETAKTELGRYDGNLGSFSYYVLLDEGEYLLEGHTIIGDILDFNTSSEIYEQIGRKYNIQLLEEVLADKFQLFLKVIVFDCLIGNTDRHHGNWAFISDDSGTWLRLSPLYDNGSSLCYLERSNRITLMMKDKTMLEAALFTKSKSQIGLGDKRPANHFGMLSYICTKYNHNVRLIMEDIERAATNEAISKLAYQLPDVVIDSNVKDFVKQFLTKRRDRMLDIFKKVELERGLGNYGSYVFNEI